MSQAVINSIRDLRGYVEDRLGPDGCDAVRDEVAAKIQYHPCRPRYGEDWRAFLEQLDILSMAEETRA